LNVRRNVSGIAITAMLLALSTWSAWGQNGSAASQSNVASVGRLSITAGELKDRFELARRSYRERTGETLPEALLPTFKRTVLEQMIRAQLLMLQAEHEGLLVSDIEAEEELKKSPYFNEGGRFNEARFEATRRANPAAFATAVKESRLRLSGARMEERVVRRHQPEEAKLRAAIERELTTATIDVLALPFDSFDGRGDEPTEREVLDYYTAHAGEFGVAPLEEVAMEIRARLRAQRDAGASEVSLRRVYERVKDDLRRPAARVRYAWFDTSAIEVQAPSDSDLDRYYRGHLADYSSFDAARGEILQKPLEEVRDQVRGRWLRERRVLEARATGERLVSAWERGRRDRKAERQATLFEETPLVTVGPPLAIRRFGRQLGDTLAARRGRPGAAMIDVDGGILVFQIFEQSDNVVPAFEAVREMLVERHERTLADEEREAAKRMFEANPSAFARDSTVHFTRLLVLLPKPLNVPLTREEVERYHREHIDKYSAPEVLAARHILISPAGDGPGQDEAARLDAEGLLRRIRAGEDFNALAREYSDDLATRESGGDLGSFGRGLMHPTFEQVAFRMRPGDVSEPVRTPHGYHLIKCTAYEPVQARPLIEVYTNVGFDAAMEKSVVIARQRADSLMRFVRTVADARRAAREMGIPIISNTKAVGERGGTVELDAYFKRLDEMKPGTRYPTPVDIRGQGFAITWVDSVSPPRPTYFEGIESEVLAEYRRVKGAGDLAAKRAELDRLEKSGWSVDSLATLFGGFVRVEDVRAGDDLGDLGGETLVDSLIFGGIGGRPALRPGETSGWVAFPGGLARMRLVARNAPDPSDMAARLERDRRKELERNLYFYFEELKREFPVRIQDPAMAATTLPPPVGADAR
jgi:parvulin-like peptidyl-prolyl isomerase